MIKIKGYAAIFDEVDSAGDIVCKNSFTTDLSEHQYRPMLFAHKADDLPIGYWLVMEEDDTGLWVEGIVTDQAVGQAVLDQALRGMSIGYQTNKVDQRNDVKYILTMELLEVSLTPVPLNRRALITDVEVLEEIKDAE